VASKVFLDVLEDNRGWNDIHERAYKKFSSVPTDDTEADALKSKVWELASTMSKFSEARLSAYPTASPSQSAKKARRHKPDEDELRRLSRR